MYGASSSHGSVQLIVLAAHPVKAWLHCMMGVCGQPVFACSFRRIGDFAQTSAISMLCHALELAEVDTIRENVVVVLSLIAASSLRCVAVRLCTCDSNTWHF